MSIQSKEDYIFFLEADAVSLFIPEDTWGRLRERIFNRIWKFERILRRAEYYSNCRTNVLLRPFVIAVQYRLSRYGFKLGYEIPINVFGPGLSIAHQGSIIVNRYARVGENCRINNGVTIGTQAGYSDKCPTIGKNVFIGTGAQIFGSITIGDDVAIGANAVVTKSFPDNCISIAGVPAKIISRKGSKTLHINSIEIQMARRAKDTKI
jgi:serine O-acetyltransferase